MTNNVPLLIVLDLMGTLAFAVNGALTAVRSTRLDIVGIVTLGMITALGGGIIRDVLIGDLPPASFNDWRYLAVAAGGGFLAFALGRYLDRLNVPITVLDAFGLALFAVIGASKAIEYGLGPGQAIILGTITGVGGGTLRDVLIRQVPTVLHSGLYAIPALVAAAVVVGFDALGTGLVAGSLTGAALCVVIRLLGVYYNIQAPGPRGPQDDQGTR